MESTESELRRLSHGGKLNVLLHQTSPHQQLDVFLLLDSNMFWNPFIIRSYRALI